MQFTLIGADATTIPAGITDAQASEMQASFTNAGTQAMATEIQFLPTFLGIAVIGLAVTLITIGIAKVKRAGK